MVPYELILHNFMCYRGTQPPLRFDGLHVSCLSGENGAGKSALLDAITWALWGEARMSDDELVAQGEMEMLVELTFLLGEQRYRVRRQRQRAASGKRGSGKSTLDLQIQENDNWRAIGATTIRETDKKIVSILRMTYETFINASFLLQGHADEFTSKQPAERKKVLADILDLGDYAQLEEQAKQRAKSLDKQIHGLDGLIGHLRDEADKLPFYEQQVREADERAATLATALADAEVDKQDADEQVRQLEAKQERRRTVREQLGTIQNDLNGQQREITDLEREIATAESLLERRDEIATGVASLNAAQHELERLDALRPTYDDLLEQRRELQDALKDARRELQSDLDGQQREAQRLRDLLSQRPALEQQRDAVQQQRDALAPLEEEHARVRQQIADIDERLIRINPLLLRRTELTGDIAKREDSLVAVREEQKRIIARLDRQLRDVAQWQADLHTAREHEQQAQTLRDELDTMRQQEQAYAERVGELRAQCKRFEQQADDIKKRQTLLHDDGNGDSTSTTACPLCGNDLGPDGVHTIAAHYEQELESLREQYRTAKRDADTQDKDLKRLRREIQTHEQHYTAAQAGAARVETLTQQIAQAEGWQAERDQAQATHDDVVRQLDTGDYEREAREALLTVEAELAELGVPTGTSTGGKGTAALDKERRGLVTQQHDLEQQLESRTGLESEAANIRYRLDELTNAADTLPAVESRIDELHTAIDTNDFAHEVREQGRTVEANIADLGYSPEAHTEARDRVKQLAHWTEEAQRLSLAESSLERDRRALERAQELCQRYQADLERLRLEDAQLEHELRAMPDARSRAQACASAVEQHRQNVNAANHDLSEKRTLRDIAQGKAAQLEQQQKERETLVQQHNLFEELAQACGKKGVQAMLIETALPEVEREANRLLSRMSNNQMHVTFDMQRSTKKGDTVETLDIKIADALGTRPYDAFSGGEAMRINFAIRIALSRLLACRAGASLETLVIDEGFGTLDADGRDRFVDAITSVQGDFQRILVITHIDELKERFPAHIQVTKTPTGSVWELV